MDAGWHFYFGGEELEGATMLERAAEALAHVADPLFGSVAALEAALRVYEREGRSLEECLRIRTSLVNASYYVDRALTQRYGEETIELLLDCTGLSNAKRYGHVLGAKHGLMIAVAVQGLRRRFVSQDRRGPAVREAMSMLFRCGQATSAVATYCLDRVAIRTLVERFAILGDLPGDHPGRLFFDHYRRLQSLVEGREGEAYRLNLTIIDRAKNPTLYPKLAAHIRRRLLAGMLFSAGVLESFRGDRKALERADELTKMEFSYFHNLVAEQLKMLCYAHRGEIDQAHEHRARYELLTVQAGAAWQAQVWTPAAMALAYLNCGDLVGLKRCLDQLDALVEEIPSLSLYRRMLTAGHLVLQGRYEDALKAVDELIQDVPPRSHIGWSRLYGGHAEALNGLGQHERARDVCLLALGCVEPEDRQFPALYLILEEQLALAEASLGQLREAARRVDLLIEEYAAFDNLRVRGSLEATRAMVALLAKDGDAFLNHHGNMERMFRSTGNANLIEQSTKLLQRAVRAGLVNPTWSVSDKEGVGSLTATEMPRTIMTVLAGVANPEMRAKYALARLVESAQASWGLLYFATGAEPRLAARTAGAIPSDELGERVAALLHPDNEEVTVATEVATAVNGSDEAPPEKVPDRFFILQTRLDSPVGVVVLRSRCAPHPELLRAIAAGLAPPEVSGEQQVVAP